MVSLGSKDGTSLIPDALVRAATQLADRHAELTARWLGAVGFTAPRPLNVPAAFLLELAAVLQLGEWERQGVVANLDIDLPSYHQAAAELAARAALGPGEFQGPDATRFSTHINTIWLQRFAWEGPSLLQTDIVIRSSDENALAEQLAEFLWEYRDELAKLSGEGNDEG